MKTTMFRRFSISLWLVLCATSSTIAVAGSKNDPSYTRDFKGWEVVCDNVKRCVAEGADDDDANLVVWLWRDAGPDGAVRLQMAASKPLGADHMHIDGRPFGTDPSKWKAWLNHDADSYPYRLATDDATVVTAWVEAARDGRAISFGDPAAADALKVSLAGLSAALLAVDDVQGRVGTVTAWRHQGVASASSVPSAQPLPVVRPAPPVPPLPDAEEHELIKAASTQFRADIQRCESALDDDDDVKAVRDESSATALSAGEALVSLGCGSSGAYNDISLWYRVHRKPPFSGQPLDFGENASIDIDVDSPPFRNALTGAVYDRHDGLVSLERVRSVGDCGSLTMWVFDGSTFVRTGTRLQGTCIGLSGDDWPWLYRTKPQ